MLLLTRLTTATARLSLAPLLRPSLPILVAARPLTTSSSTRASATPRKVASSVGSGQGGALEKIAAAANKLAKQEKAKAVKASALAAKLKIKEKAARAKAAKAKAAVKAKGVKEALKLKAKKDAARVATTTGRTIRKSTITPPKAPGTAWTIFLRDYSKGQRDALPAGEKMPNASKLAHDAAPLYAALAPSERASLEARHVAAVEEYVPVLAHWKKTLTPQQVAEENKVRYQLRKKNLSGKKNLKVEGAPKRPTTSYFLYAAEQRNGGHLGSEASVTEQAKISGAAWKALSPEKKQPYQEASAKARAEYTGAMQRFNEIHGLAEATA